MSSRRNIRAGGGSSNASPFIKPDRMRRSFLNKKKPGLNGKKTVGVKKEESDNETIGVEKNIKKEDGATNEKDYNEFPLRAITREKLENMRIHLLKFQSKKNISPKVDFHLPIRLHRKDTRNLQFQLTRAEIVQRQKEISEYKKTQQGSSNPMFANKNNIPNATPLANSITNPTTTNINDKINNTNNSIPPQNNVNGPSNQQPNTNIINNALNPSEAPNNNNTVNMNNNAITDPNTVNSTNNPIIKTQLEVAGLSEDPTKIGKVTYDGQETVPDDNLDGANPNVDLLNDVAPDGGGRVKRGNMNKRKTRQLKVLDENAKKLRFEEFYPWVMEDFDGFNTWVGSYEAGNSDSYVLLSVEDDGSFTMTPADKVYKFTARNKYATLTIDEAEKRMDKKNGEVPRWLMKHLDNIGTTTTRYDRTKRRLKAASGAQGNDLSDDEQSEHDDNSEVELDYDEEFADDEEAPIMDGNEQENKESEQRMKKEMLQANAMGLRDDEDEDILSMNNHDEEGLLNDKKSIDQQGEQIKKALQKTELAALYSDDDDEINPYLSESDMEPENDENKEKNEESDDKTNIKKEDGDNIDSTTGIKKEESSSIPPKANQSPQIRVKSIKDCILILKAKKSFLENFEKGEWNPTTAKRRIKEEEEEDNTNALKSGNNNIQVKQEDDTQHIDKKIKLEQDDTTLARLITEQDIRDAIGDDKVNVKQFGKSMRKQFPGPENKKLMFSIVKKLCKKVDNEHMELKK